MSTTGLSELREQEIAGVPQVLNGLSKLTAFRATGVADGNVAIDAVFRNPANSGLIVLLSPALDNGGLADLDLGENISITAIGTEPPVFNRRRGNLDDTDLDVGFGGTYTTDGSTLNTVISGGSAEGAGQSRAGQRVFELTPWVLNPGESMRWQITNRSGGSTRFSLAFAWDELQK